MAHPWHPGETPEEEQARRAAYQRLLLAAKRTGTPIARLAAALRAVAHNEIETRRFLARDVYGVPDHELDALVRKRLAAPNGENP